VQPFIHCYTAADIRTAYGVAGLTEKGDGQTIVLVDSYGSPTAAQDLQTFHDTFFPSEPAPNFTAVFPNGQLDYNNTAKGNGQSGPAAAANWAGEATLDIEWAYAIAPHAHIVLLAVPPAETEGVQGFPTLFKGISQEIDATPSGTVFSMSFGVTEQTFGGAAQVQTSKFDAVFQKGIAKGDSFFASSGDSGSLGVAKQHRDTATYSFPVDGWPASSPYVTAVGGTQLQYGWTWNPQSDIAFNADGTRLITSGDEGIRVYVLPIGDLAALARAHLSPAGQQQIALYLRMLEVTGGEVDALRAQLVSAAGQLRGARALAGQLYGVGPVTALALCCWLGGAGRFSFARKAVRFTGLDVTVCFSDGKRSPGHLSRQGPPVLRWCVYEAGKAHARASAPDTTTTRR